MTEEAIDVDFALKLRERGYSWPKIGRILADERDRLMPYLGRSVSNAVYKARKENQ